MNEITVREEAGALQAIADRAAGMEQLLRMMAEQLKRTGDRIDQLEAQVRVLEKVTPAQAARINAAMRERAGEVSARYRLAGKEKEVLSAIRKEIRVQMGIRTAKECPRCEYQICLDRIGIWEDWKALKMIREEKP